MKTNLNYSWRFAKGRIAIAEHSPIRNYETVMIPHCVTMFPAQYLNEKDYQGEYTYQLIFDCKDPLPVKVLRFEGVMLQFDLYLNGKSLGHYISGYLPVEIDVSEVLLPKGNILTVYVDGSEDPSVPPFGKVLDYLTFAGIYREVSLLSYPSLYIKDVFVRASASGDVVVKTSLSEDSHVAYRVYDREGGLVLESDKERFHIPNVHPWSIIDPYLYRLEAVTGNVVESKFFGFRDVSFTPQGFFLNGKRLPLIGLNRHQTFPYFGPAAPKPLQEEDALLLKHSGINVVRTSHYPQSEHFLDACDRLGLLVIDEIPGWQFIGNDPKWVNNCVDFAKRMILKERSHTCLIAYGLRIDESDDNDELYSKIQEQKVFLDPSRQSIGVRNFKDSHCLEDVYGYNDFSCGPLDHGVDPSKEIKGAKGKPILITESNGHMFPTKSFDETAKRAEHAYRHARVLNDVLSDSGYCGAITWCAFDYNTHKDFGSNDHICHHGVYDIFRNPKFAAYFFKSQGKAPVLDIGTSMLPGDYNAAHFPAFYAFTNGDYVDVYKNNRKVGRFYPDTKSFPNLPHPPILIDDIIGDLFDEPNISEEDGKKIVAAFNYYAQNGFENIRLRDKLLMARFMAKYHFTFPDVYQLYTKYIQSWGEGSTLWRFEAFRDGKKIATALRGPSTDFHLDISLTRDTLVNQETYDCLSLHIYKKDQYGTTMPYASDPVIVETEGPIEVYGPKLFSLYGGASTIYLRSLPVKSPQEATVKITCMGETLERHFIVKNAD